MRALVWLDLAAIHLTNQAYNVVFDIVFAFEHIDLDPIFDGTAQHGGFVGLAYDVFVDGMLACDHEIFVY